MGMPILRDARIGSRECRASLNLRCPLLVESFGEPSQRMNVLTMLVLRRFEQTTALRPFRASSALIEIQVFPIRD